MFRRTIFLGAAWFTYFLLLVPFAAAQQAPVLFYSDIESGPSTGGQNGNGAFVTLYGNNFGDSRGFSTVTIGDVPAASYPVWTNTRIAFQLSTAATTGTIVVHLPEVSASNALPFTVRKGKIHFVSASGNDHASGMFGNPWASVPKAAYVMAPGDITYVMNGVHQNGIDDYNASLAVASSGNPGFPKALVAYPGAQVAIGAASGPEYGIRTPAIHGGPFSHWTVAGFIVRGGNEAFGIVGASDWRIVGNDISCPRGGGSAGCVEVAASTEIKLLGNKVHDTSPPGTSKTYHSVYFTTDSNHIEVGWNTIVNNHSCRGIQFHSSPEDDNSGFNQYDLSVHDNVITGQVCDGINFATIDPSRGQVVAYNNLIYHVGLGPDPPDGEASYACIASPGITNHGSPGKGTVSFYNNTLSDCGARGGSDAGAFNIGSGSPMVRLENNLVQLKDGENYFSPGSHASLVEGSSNAWYGAGRLPIRFATALKKNVTSGPILAGSPLNFQLPNNSPATGAGTSTGLSFDLAGTPRASSGSFDIGAYQHSASPAVMKP